MLSIVSKCLSVICVLLLLNIFAIECRIIGKDSPISNNNDNELDVKDHSHRLKRFISLGIFGSNAEYKNCTSPGNRPGKCKPASHCIMEGVNNLMSFTQYICHMGGIFYGMCCPEKIDILVDVVDNEIGEETKIEPKIVTSGNLISDKLQDRACGISRKGKSKIVGGRPTDPKDYPWMVALIRYGINQFCGGVLISNRHVLTAAHCVSNLKPYEIRARLGEYDFTRTDDSDSRDYRIVSIKQHSDFKETFLNDIAILVLNRIVIFSDYILPICLPEPEQNYVNKTAMVAGWGTLGFGEPFSDILMEVDLPIWEQTSCETKLKQNISETSFCAGSYNERKDSCQGDSGGPLMYKLSSGRWTTVGIVSWGMACGRIGHPAIYTRVDKYLKWIDDNTVI